MDNVEGNSLTTWAKIICGSLHLVGEFIAENEDFLRDQRIQS